jgi:hypothetical protein
LQLNSFLAIVTSLIRISLLNNAAQHKSDQEWIVNKQSSSVLHDDIGDAIQMCMRNYSKV